MRHLMGKSFLTHESYLSKGVAPRVYISQINTWDKFGIKSVGPGSYFNM